MEIIYISAVLFSVIVVFSLGFWAGKTHEKISLELTIEKLNFESLIGGNWEFSKDELSCQMENKG